MHRGVATRTPAALVWVVGRKLIGVALPAEPAAVRVEHRGVVGAMRTVTFSASVVATTGNHRVLEDKRTGLFGVAGHALIFDAALLGLIILGRVRGMAIATHHSSLGNWVVILVAEIARCARMARAAKGRFVCPKHRHFVHLRGEANRSCIGAFLEPRKVGVAIRVDLVATDATHVSVRVLGALPMARSEGLFVASKASRRGFGRAHLAERDHFGVLFVRMEFARTVAALAPTLRIR